MHRTRLYCFLILATSVAFVSSTPGFARSPQSNGVEITNEIFAPQRLPVSLTWTNYIVKRPSSSREINHLSIDNIDGKDVLTFGYAIGARCALELSPQPSSGDGLSQRKTFRLINPTVVESSRAAIGGPCRAMSNYIADWSGELAIQQNSAGDLVMELLLEVRGTNGRISYTLEAERFIARKLIIDHAQIAKRREESNRALAGLMAYFAAAAISDSNSRTSTTSSVHEKRCRIEYSDVPDGRGGMTTGGAKQVCD